jgi:electron transport complex protein RnfE
VVELVMQAYTTRCSKLGIFIRSSCELSPWDAPKPSPAERHRARAGRARLGLGYTIALSVLATFRQIIATGAITIYENPITLFGPAFEPFRFLVEAPGAFICLGLMLGLMNILGKK